MRCFFVRDVLLVGAIVNLPLQQRSKNVARTDRIAGNTACRIFQCHNFGKPDDAVFRRDIRSFVNRSDDAMHGSNVKNPAPVALLHGG